MKVTIGHRSAAGTTLVIETELVTVSLEFDAAGDPMTAILTLFAHGLKISLRGLEFQTSELGGVDLMDKGGLTTCVIADEDGKIHEMVNQIRDAV